MLSQEITVHIVIMHIISEIQWSLTVPDPAKETSTSPLLVSMAASGVMAGLTDTSKLKAILIS